MRGVGASVRRAYRIDDGIPALLRVAQKHATGFVGIGCFAVLANCVELGLLHSEHRNRHRDGYSSQNRSLKYLSAESHKIVTMTASSPFAAHSSAIRSAPATAAAADTPTSRPSSRGNRRAMA